MVQEPDDQWSPAWDDDEYQLPREEEALNESLERRDDRWDAAGLQSWLILLAMIVLYLVWMGSVYLLEPGIR